MKEVSGGDLAACDQNVRPRLTIDAIYSRQGQ
jgi:hypothetical protein